MALSEINKSFLFHNTYVLFTVQHSSMGLFNLIPVSSLINVAAFFLIICLF